MKNFSVPKISSEIKPIPKVRFLPDLSLSVVIRDREGILLAGEVEAVSSYNIKGPFDILPLHANFISLINKNVKVVFKGGAERQLPVEQGVIRVKNNKVEVFLGILR